MAAQNDPSIPESPSILHSPSQSESLSSKFLRKSKFLSMKSNVNVENSVNCSPSTNDPLPNPESSDHPHHQQIHVDQPPSEMAALAAESDIKPITHPPTDVVLHAKDKTLRATTDLQNDHDKDAASSTPSSPESHSPSSPLMEIIPPPLSHRLQVTTPLESVTAISSSNTNSTSTQELQSLSEIQHTPCRLYPS